MNKYCLFSFIKFYKQTTDINDLFKKDEHYFAENNEITLLNLLEF